MAEIKNALPPPSNCDNCQSLNVELTTNDKIYGKLYGKWPFVYHCIDCSSIVGCHPNTFIPLGKMADRQTRYLRKQAHLFFDKLWQEGLFSRSMAYLWLAEELHIPFNSCHISWLTKSQLIATIRLSKNYFSERAHIAARRKEKRHATRSRQHEYEKKRIRLRKTSR